MPSDTVFAPAIAPKPTQFLLSRRLDIGFLFLGGAGLSVLLMGARYFDLHFLAIALTLAVVMDFPHVLHTYLRIGLDPEEQRLYRAEFFCSLALISAVAISLALAGQFWLLVSIWVYWQPYHVMKQHDGIAGLYAVKNGYTGDRRWLRGVLFLGCAAPVLYRVADTGLAFGVYKIFGHPLPFSGVHVPTPPIGWPVVALAYAAALICLAGLGRQVLRRAAPPWPSLALTASAVLTYNFAYLLFHDLYTMILAATAAHALQYHAICWLFVRGKHRDGALAPRPTLGQQVLKSLTARRNLAVYAGALLLTGSMLASSEFLIMGLLPLIFVLHHFFMDGVIWKASRNPGVGRHMRLRPAV